MITNALENKSFPVYGDGKNIREWLHVEDHCRGIDAVISNGRLGETYNIDGCNEWANIDIVRLICDRLDKLSQGEKPKQNLITFVKDRLGHDRRYAIDTRKITDEVVWQPKYNF